MPHARSSAGCPSCTKRSKYAISGPSRWNSAHHRAISPWCQVSGCEGCFDVTAGRWYPGGRRAQDASSINESSFVVVFQLRIVTLG